jgi:hypothetical protein
MNIDHDKILKLKSNRIKLGSGLKDVGNAIAGVTKTLGDALVNVESLQTGIQATIGVSERLSVVLMEVAKRATALEQRYSALNTIFGVSSKSAAQFGYQLETISAEFKVGIETTTEYAKNLNTIAAGFVAGDKAITGYRKNLFEAQKIMITQLGVTAEAAAGYELYASTIARSGKDQLDNQLNIAAAIEDSTSLTGTYRDLVEGIGKLTANLQIQFGRIPGSLELAVLKSRALGLSLSDLNKTGETLLNIEQSVGNELEYQALTGRRLVNDQGESLTNLYRQAQFRGDANAQADIMNQILEQEGEHLKTNFMARQAMSKLFGIDEATLSRSIQKKNVLDRIEAETGKDVFAMKPDEILKIAEDLELPEDEKEAIREQRTTDQLIYEEIKSLNSKIVKGVLGSGEDAAALVGSARTDLQAAMSNIEQFQQAIAGENFATVIGATKQFGIAYKQSQLLVADLEKTIPGFTTIVDGIGNILTSLPVVGKTFGAIGNLISSSIDAPGAMADFGEFQTQLNSPKMVKAEDAVIQFNPQDKFMSIAGGNAMIAGTDAGGNQALANQLAGNSGISDEQINKLANAMAVAMKGVTITTDPLYQSNNLNGDRFA